jgi:hypothetical protein
MHVELGHFNEQHTLAEIYRRYYWHNCIEEVSKIVKAYLQCQPVKRISNDVLPSSLLNPLEGPSMWKCRRSWNLGPLPTSSTKGAERGVLEVSGLD